jgi:hypothetical protein
MPSRVRQGGRGKKRKGVPSGAPWDRALDLSFEPHTRQFGTAPSGLQGGFKNPPLHFFYARGFKGALPL